MLYNKAWKKELLKEVEPAVARLWPNKPDIKVGSNISMDDFIAWLETKNPNETYNYQNRSGQCCLGQYMADRGVEWPQAPHQWGSTYKAVSYAAGGGGSHVAFQFVL